MHASHVIIRGHVFAYAEKEPFLSAGESVLGALEYDQSVDQVKCHECGIWIEGLGNHIKAHGMSRREYNQRFGLRDRCPLSSPSIREKHRNLASGRYALGGNLRRVSKEKSIAAVIASNSNRKRGKTAELDNEEARCLAQSLFRLQLLAAQVGHTPTETERRAIGLGSPVLCARFGSTERAMRLIGLTPNREGGNELSPLPCEYPDEDSIRKKWESPMPWPKEYFDVGLIALERRSDS